MNAHHIVTRRGLAGLVAAAAVLLTAACGSSGDDHNAADVTFATQMIPHHAQAVTMSAMVKGKGVDQQVAALASDIDAAQAPEIKQMSGWLKTWGEKVPATDGSMQGMHSMPGMMSSQDMSSLQAATGAAFQEQWLTMMIAHHQGAVTMADTELAKGENKSALALARSIKASQSKQIATMKQLLER